MYRVLMTVAVMVAVGGFAWTMDNAGTPSVYGQVMATGTSVTTTPTTTPTTTATASPTATASATATPVPVDCSDGISYGFKPPAGGYGTFAFCGGTFAELLDASDCPSTTAVFFYNKADGGFAVWIPASDVLVVNEEILGIWPLDIIPEGTIFTARCA